MNPVLAISFLFSLLAAGCMGSPFGPDVSDGQTVGPSSTHAAAECDAGRCTYELCVEAGYQGCAFFACAEGDTGAALATWQVDLLLAEREGSRETEIPASAACAEVTISVEGITPDLAGPNVVEVRINGEFDSRCEFSSFTPATTSCGGRTSPIPGVLGIYWHIIGASSLQIHVARVDAPTSA